ncbi:MAG: protein FdrA, partial [Actinomycetota bacterium]|nr:protein FdrA [Actinomycetota bacterium]
MSWHVKVIANRYADSVKLMGIARGLRARDGVSGCEMGMGTTANLEALAARGVEAQAGPSDLIVAVEADSEDVAAQTIAKAEEELASGGGEAAAAGATAKREPPRSLVSALRQLSEPNVALISVAGEYATLEAHRALSAGMHVFLFSDHVSLEDELALKQRGEELGLLVMGPGCGTAMLANVGLGFANVVTAGSVGIVAAAGTGAQESACLLDAAGVGVSQIVGVGGRDLSADIGGIMFRQAIHMLAADDATETLLLVSKPPAAEVVASLADDLPDGKRVVAAFVGWDGGAAPFEIHDTLE